MNVLWRETLFIDPLWVCDQNGREAVRDLCEESVGVHCFLVAVAGGFVERASDDECATVVRYARRGQVGWSRGGEKQ